MLKDKSFKNYMEIIFTHLRYYNRLLVHFKTHIINRKIVNSILRHILIHLFYWEASFDFMTLALFKTRKG